MYFASNEDSDSNVSAAFARLEDFDYFAGERLSEKILHKKSEMF